MHNGWRQRKNENYRDADEHMRWPLPELPTSTAPNKRMRREDSDRGGGGGMDDPFLSFIPSDYTWTPDARWPQPREPWCRSHDPATDDLELFILKIEQYTQTPTVHKCQWPADMVRGTGKVHTIRIFGLTAEGRTVTLEVHGYCPYLYVYAPTRLLKAPRDERGQVLDEIQGAFEDAILDSPYRYNDHSKRTPAIANVELRPRRALNKFYPPTEKEVAINKRAFEGKPLPEDATGDDGSKKDVMVMVSTYLEEDLKLLRSAIHGVSLRGKVIDDHEMLAGVQRETFDSDIELTMRFMSDLGLKGCNWLRVPAGSYDLVRNVPARQLVQSLDTADVKNLAGTGFFRTRTFTQTIANCRWDSIVAINDRDEYPQKMRVLSFDLETKSLNPVDEQGAEPYRLGDIMDENDDNMPVANDPLDARAAERISEATQNDEEVDEETKRRAGEVNWSAPRDNGAGIIQISAVLMEYPSHEIVKKALFTLGDVVPKLVGEDVDNFVFGQQPGDLNFNNDKEERRMLHAFTRYMALADPDVITGYNILGFDWNYLIQRYEYLGIPPLLGRTGKPVKVNKNVFQSRSQGTREYMRPEMDGRISLDMRVEVERSGRKLRQYKLDVVAMVYLDERKEVCSPPIVSRASSSSLALRCRVWWRSRLASHSNRRMRCSSKRGWCCSMTVPATCSVVSMVAGNGAAAGLGTRDPRLAESKKSHVAHARQRHCVMSRPPLVLVHTSADWGKRDSISSSASLARPRCMRRRPTLRGFMLIRRSGPNCPTSTYLPCLYSVVTVWWHAAQLGNASPSILSFYMLTVSFSRCRTCTTPTSPCSGVAPGPSARSWAATASRTRCCRCC